MTTMTARILREYGPFPGVAAVHGLTWDGSRVWFATGDRILALEPDSGILAGSLAVPGMAGTAFDGRHLFQVTDRGIERIDPESGTVLAVLPLPGGAAPVSGLAWAEGSLWLGEYRARCIHQLDPQTGRILRTLRSDRFVTGVTWVDGELWHGTWEDEASELRRIDPADGSPLARLQMPAGTIVSGLESDGADRFFCGGGSSGKVRAVRRPRGGGRSGG